MYLPPQVSSYPEQITPEVLERVDEIIARYKGKPGSLIPVLQQVQVTAGFLPVELQEHIALGLGIPGSDVFGVVTFYSFFSMTPRGRNVIKVCLGTACFVQGGNETLNRIMNSTGLDVNKTSDDQRFTLEVVRCVGACGLAPVTIINEDTHRKFTADQVSEVLAQYQ